MPEYILEVVGDCAANSSHLSLVGRQYALSVGDNLIGRSRENTVNIGHLSLSKHHAKCHFVDTLKGFVVFDLGSKHGTFLNDGKAPVYMAPLSSCSRIEKVAKDPIVKHEDEKYKTLKKRLKDTQMKTKQAKDLTVDEAILRLGGQLRLGQVTVVLKYGTSAGSSVEVAKRQNQSAVSALSDPFCAWRPGVHDANLAIHQIRAEGELLSCNSSSSVLETERIFSRHKRQRESELAVSAALIEEMRCKQIRRAAAELNSNAIDNVEAPVETEESYAEKVIAVGSESIGYNILRKLGWDAKHALGKIEGLPMNEPLSVIMRRKGAGLGTT